ncbi:MAG: hypothetical protein ACTHKT_14290, partial [Solirubrobacterales bacterium]
SSRTTPNGKVIVFESKAKLTPYENAGHTEIYRWEEEGTGVECVSCQGAPEPAKHDARLQDLDFVNQAMVIHNLSDDGSRVFFETKEALTGSDTDGINDVYEWQKESLSSRVDLISSGKSKEYVLAEGGGGVKGVPKPNVLLSITPNATDVLFMAQDVLVPGAGEFGTQALYDARVNGGFAQPAIPRACSEEECKGPGTGVAPSHLRGEKSSSTQGPGNVTPKKHKHRCRKPKNGKKGHCRRHGKKKGRRAARPSTRPIAATSFSPSSSGSSERGARPAQEAAPAIPGTRTLEGSFEDFGIESLSGALSTTAAAQHPDFTTNFSLTHSFQAGKPFSDAHAEEISVSLPPGLLGNPNAIPKCETGAFTAFANCPPDSQVGVAKTLITGFPEAFEPIYNLTPPHPEQEIARLGFFAAIAPVYIDVSVRSASDYGVTATVHSPPSLEGVLASETVLWGNPADPSHDSQRLAATEAVRCALVESACEAGVRIQEFDASGNFLGRFSYFDASAARGIATDSAGNVWITDTADNRILEFSPTGELIRLVGERGSEEGQLQEPIGIATDSAGNVWVSDTGNNRIEEFASNGEFIQAVGSEGAAPGQFTRPEGVAVDSADDVWVVDASNKRLQEFKPNGEFVKTVGSAGAGNGQFDGPQGIAIDSEDNVWVSDVNYHRVQEFKANGEFLRSIGGCCIGGTGNGQFREPEGLATDSVGDLWVADAGNSRLQEFSPTGSFIRVVGGPGTGDGQFSKLHDVAVAPSGHILTLQPEGSRPSGIPAGERKAFMTNPSACGQGTLGLAVTSYQLPGRLFTASASLPAITDCTGLPFA